MNNNPEVMDNKIEGGNEEVVVTPEMQEKEMVKTESMPNPTKEEAIQEKKGFLSKLFKKKEKAPESKVDEAKNDLKEMATIYAMGAGSPQQSGGVSAEKYAKKWGVGLAEAQKIDEINKKLSFMEKGDEAKALTEQRNELRNQFAQMILDKASE